VIRLESLKRLSNYMLILKLTGLILGMKSQLKFLKKNETLSTFSEKHTSEV
jgi:hypothetical protein